MKRLSEVLINPDKISKIVISKEEKRLFYTINRSILSTLPIFNWFISGIKVMSNDKKVIESFSSYDSFNFWAKNNEYCLDTIPKEENFWQQRGDIPLHKKPFMIFYGLDGIVLGKMEFKTQDSLEKALAELRQLRFILISNSR